MSDVRIQDATRPKAIINELEFQEQRRTLDTNNQPEYVGFTNIPNAGTDLPVWMIYKYEYDGTATSTFLRKRLPDDGFAYDYIFDDAANYFT